MKILIWVMTRETSNTKHADITISEDVGKNNEGTGHKKSTLSLLTLLVWLVIFSR